MSRAVIFLDVDGVLNSLRSCVALGGYKATQLDPVAIGLLEFLCDCLASAGRSPEVVISSTWRKKHRDLSWWNDLFARHGALNVRVVGFTPDLGGPRGREVAAWIADNAPGVPFVCLDDDSDFEPGQPLILTAHVGGLHLGDVDEAFRILTGDRLFPEGLADAGKWRALRAIKAARPTTSSVPA